MIRRLFTTNHALKYPKVYPENIDDLRKMIAYRCSRSGSKETELILKEWAEKNLDLMNREELIQFHQEVVDQETVDLYQIFLGKMPHNNLKYLEELVKFVGKKLA